MCRQVDQHHPSQIAGVELPNLACVHWWFFPDSYDDWVPQVQCANMRTSSTRTRIRINLDDIKNNNTQAHARTDRQTYTNTHTRTHAHTHTHTHTLLMMMGSHRRLRWRVNTLRILARISGR